MFAAQFQDWVLEDFRFLLTEYGFRCVEQRPGFVCFKSSRVYLQVAHDGLRSFELEVRVGLVRRRSARPEPGFTLAALLEQAGAPDADRYNRAIQAASEDVVRRFVHEMAGLVAKYGRPALSGDAKVFKNLALQAQARAEAYAQETKLAFARAQAETAWRKKDYTSVIAALTPMKEALTPSERKRLDLARKRGP